MNKKKTQSKPIAKLEVATEQSGYAVIINTEKPAARKGEERENDSRYAKIAMHRRWTTNCK